MFMEHQRGSKRLLTKAYAVMKNEYGFTVYNEQTKFFFDKTDAMNYMFELINDPENRKLMMPPDTDNQMFKVIEVEIEV